MVNVVGTMNTRLRLPVAATIFTLILLSVVAIAWAQTSAGFDLRWHVVGSSDTSASTDFRVHGTVGQNIVSPSTASSAAFNVTGGFWVEGPAIPDEPTNEPTDEPTDEPTAEPTTEPTAEPADVRLPFILR